MRSIWSGAISFGLVNIPVKLYSATGADKIDFDLLSKKELSPVRYARISKISGKEIPFEEITKGFEYDKGKYVVMDENDFKLAAAKKSETIDIINFVHENEIDSIYFEKPYYLEPGKGASRPYALLRDAIKKSGMIGIGLFIIRNRQHLASLKVSGNVLLLNQLRFYDQVRKPEGLNIPETGIVSGKELELAIKLIEQNSEVFKPELYKDSYTESLRKIIDSKVKGKPLKIKEVEKYVPPGKDLMETLKESLKASKKRAA